MSLSTVERPKNNSSSTTVVRGSVFNESVEARCYDKADSHQKKFEKALLNFVIQDSAPLNTCERIGFKNLIHTLDPKLHIPQRRTVVRMLEKRYEEVKKIIMMFECIVTIMIVF